MKSCSFGAGMSISQIKFNPVPVSLDFVGDRMRILFPDGRELLVPLSLFPKLQAATPEERSHWELIGNGIGVHWPLLDEDISIENLLIPGSPKRPRSAR